MAKVSEIAKIAIMSNKADHPETRILIFLFLNIEIPSSPNKIGFYSLLLEVLKLNLSHYRTVAMTLHMNCMTDSINIHFFAFKPCNRRNYPLFI